MTAGKLDLEKDLKFGTLNAIEDQNVKNSGDKRRTSSLQALNASIREEYETNTLEDVEVFRGIVVHKRPIRTPRYQNRSSLLRGFIAGDPELPETSAPAAAEDTGNNQVYKAAPYTAYKVYVPELEPRPAPSNFNDPVLHTYPDILTPPGRPDLKDLPLGAIVEVVYEDPARLYNPQIVNGTGDSYILMANYEDQQSNIQLMFGDGPVQLMGGVGPLGATGKGNDMTCPSYNQQDANSLDMTYVHGSDYQTGKQLHQNDWANPPENSVSGWALPLKPSEATPSLVPGSLRAPSGINRSRNGAFHKALDLSAKTGTPLYAVAAGTMTINRPVCFKGKEPSSNGNRITYKTNTGYTVTYIHLDMPSPVKKGETVTKGQLLGYVGDTGLSTGAHLHFEVKKGGTILHPADFYPPEWIMMAGTRDPVSTVHRQSVPNIHVPTKEPA